MRKFDTPKSLPVPALARSHLGRGRDGNSLIPKNFPLLQVADATGNCQSDTSDA